MKIFATFTDSELGVLLKGDSRVSTLWWLSGNHGDSWQRSEVLIGRVPQDFTILFEGLRDVNQPGHVAIDDVSFTNCSFPGRPPTFLTLLPCSFETIKTKTGFLAEPDLGCPESMFKCNNSVCVDLDRVCDYSDDCGDRSDESDCGELIQS